MMKNGKMLCEIRELPEIRQFAIENVAKLPEKYKRIKNPEPIPVTISERLDKLRKELIENAKNMK